MDDFAVRLIVAGGIAVAAALAALLARRGRAWRRRVFESGDLEPGIHLFSSASCSSCARARSVIERTGLPFSEHTFEQEADLLERMAIARVPTVAWIPPGGGAGWAAEGVPTERWLSRWVGP